MNENIVDKRVYKTLTKIENGMIRLLEDKCLLSAFLLQ